MEFLYVQLIQNKQKAIVGYIVVALVQYLSNHGFVVPAHFGDVVTALLVGLFGYVGVYLKRNKA